jgi:hypothetical protein
VNSARLSARFLAQQGRPWDLMAWSFSRKAAQVPGQKVQKTAVQLQREAAVVLAQGGGFQAYFKQKRDGSIYDEEMPVMAEVAAFCRARQALVHHSKSVPQIAVLLSLEDQYRRNTGLFSRNLTRVNGVLRALVESQQAVDVLGEHHLTGRLGDYPLIIVPECDYLDPKFRDALADYAKKGGNLLLVGAASAKLFPSELKVTLTGDLKPSAPLKLSRAGSDSELTARWQNVTLGAGVRAFGELQPVKTPGLQAQPAASITTHGRGKIAAIYFTAGQVYTKDRPPALRDFIAAVARELFPQPLVEVSGTHEVDVTLARNHGKLQVHLINTSGPHATEPIQQTITPLGPLQVTLRLPRKPARITLEPGAHPLTFAYHDGRAHFAVPRVEIYDIVVVQE